MAAFIELLNTLGIIASAKEATKEVVDQQKDIMGIDIIF